MGEDRERERERERERAQMVFILSFYRSFSFYRLFSRRLESSASTISRSLPSIPISRSKQLLRSSPFSFSRHAQDLLYLSDIYL